MSDHAFSAEVELTLVLPDHSLPVSHTGPDYFILQDCPEELSPKEAVLVVKIDEHVKKTPIRLLDPLSSTETPIRYERLPATSPVA